MRPPILLAACFVTLAMQICGEKSIDISGLDFLLWPYADENLRLSAPSAYFPNAVVGASPWDLAFGTLADIHDVVHGGLLVTNFTPDAVEALHRVAFLQPYTAGSDVDSVRSVKLVVVSDNQMVLTKKGILDDNDHMTLGDYGNEYGEYRWGVFMRFVQRMIRRGGGEADRYFADQQAIFDLPVDSVIVELGLSHRRKDDHVYFKTRAGVQRRLLDSEFNRWLLEDMKFALAVHPERVSVEVLREKIQVVIRDASVNDYPLHGKQKPWQNWTSYFGPVEPQHLAVVAQTAREKAAMVGDDLSDFYTGRITEAVLEGAVRVTLASPLCKDFKRALDMHGFGCSPTASGTRAPSHSPFYSLAAKEKLFGELGVAAESSLVRIFGRFDPWPHLAVLHFDEDSASFGIFEGKTFARGKEQSLVKKLPRGVDLIHIHSCKFPAHALTALVDGGLILVEGLTCKRHNNFERFIEQARLVGAVAVGRRIAVIVRRGRYQPDPQRARWPQPSASVKQEVRTGGEVETSLPAFLQKDLGLEAGLLYKESSSYRLAFASALRARGERPGRIAQLLDQLGKAEALFKALDVDKSGTLSSRELGEAKSTRKKLFGRKLTREQAEGKKEDERNRRMTPRSQWPPLVSATEVQESVPLDRGYARVQPLPAMSATGDNMCDFHVEDIGHLDFFRFGTREDGQAMVMYIGSSRGQRYVFKLGRYVDLKREALVVARLTACGSTSFARTCSLLSASWLQDDAGWWRDSRAWPERINVHSTEAWEGIDIFSDQRGHCTDCLYSEFDVAGAYLKDRSMRAHIELCPSECVVFQVQEFIEGLALEQLAWPYRDKFAPGHDRTKGMTVNEEKEATRRTIAAWFIAANLQPENDTMSTVALTELVAGRIVTTLVHFHAKCGIVHDDMHVGNVILTSKSGDVKIIDWELARVVQTDEASLQTLWTHERGNAGILMADRGTQCDSLWRGCVCEWPYQVVAGTGRPACNLFGLKAAESKKVLHSLARRMPSLGTEFLGQHAATFKDIIGRSEL